MCWLWLFFVGLRQACSALASFGFPPARLHSRLRPSSGRLRPTFVRFWRHLDQHRLGFLWLRPIPGWLRPIPGWLRPILGHWGLLLIRVATCLAATPPHPTEPEPSGDNFLFLGRLIVLERPQAFWTLAPLHATLRAETIEAGSPGPELNANRSCWPGATRRSSPWHS